MTPFDWLSSLLSLWARALDLGAVAKVALKTRLRAGRCAA
jgi:hypothetical protein